MRLIRELIYDEKTLDDFDIDSEESVFKLFLISNEKLFPFIKA